MNKLTPEDTLLNDKEIIKSVEDEDGIGYDFDFELDSNFNIAELKATLKDQAIKTFNQVSQYYESVVIPQKIKEAKKKLIEEIEPLIGWDSDRDYYKIRRTDWQQLKKERGIE